MGAIGFSKVGERIQKNNPNVTEYIFLLNKTKINYLVIIVC